MDLRQSLDPVFLAFTLDQYTCVQLCTFVETWLRHTTDIVRHASSLVLHDCVYQTSYKSQYAQHATEMAENTDLFALWQEHNKKVPAGTAGVPTEQDITALWDALEEEQQSTLVLEIQEADKALIFAQLADGYIQAEGLKTRPDDALIDTLVEIKSSLIQARMQSLEASDHLLRLQEGMGAHSALCNLERTQMVGHREAIRREQASTADLQWSMHIPEEHSQRWLTDIQRKTSELEGFQYRPIKSGGHGQIGLWTHSDANGELD